MNELQNTVIILKINLLNDENKIHQKSTEWDFFKSNVESLQEKSSELKYTMN